MIRNTFIFLILSLVLEFGAFDCIVNAATTATPSATASSSASLSLKEKLDHLKKEVASKAAEIKKEVNKKLQNKIVIGQILTVSSDKVTVQTKKGEKSISVNEYTAFQIDSALQTGKKKAVIKSTADLTKDDYIVALGDIDDKGILTAKKIIKLGKPADDSKAFWGQIIESTPSAALVKVRDGSNLKVNIGKDTSIFTRGQRGAVSDLMLNKTVIMVGNLIEKDTLLGKYLYVLSGGSPVVSDKAKIATQTAEASKSASKSAAPKKK